VPATSRREPQPPSAPASRRGSGLSASSVEAVRSLSASLISKANGLHGMPQSSSSSPRELASASSHYVPEAERQRAESRVRERRAVLAAEQQQQPPARGSAANFDPSVERRRAEERLKDRRVSVAASAASAVAAAETQRGFGNSDHDGERKRAESRLRERKFAEGATLALAGEEEASRRRARGTAISIDEARARTGSRLRAAALSAREQPPQPHALESRSLVMAGAAPKLSASGVIRARHAAPPQLSPRSQVAASVTREQASQAAALRVVAYAQRETARAAKQAHESIAAARAYRRAERSVLRTMREERADRQRAETYAINALMKAREDDAYSLYCAERLRRGEELADDDDDSSCGEPDDITLPPGTDAGTPPSDTGAADTGVSAPRVLSPSAGLALAIPSSPHRRIAM